MLDKRGSNFIAGQYRLTYRHHQGPPARRILTPAPQFQTLSIGMQSWNSDSAICGILEGTDATAYISASYPSVQSISDDDTLFNCTCVISTNSQTQAPAPSIQVAHVRLDLYVSPAQGALIGLAYPQDKSHVLWRFDGSIDQSLDKSQPHSGRIFGDKVKEWMDLSRTLRRKMFVDGEKEWAAQAEIKVPVSASCLELARDSNILPLGSSDQTHSDSSSSKRKRPDGEEDCVWYNCHEYPSLIVDLPTLRVPKRQRRSSIRS